MKKDEESSLQIINIVACASVADSIDLEFIAGHIRDCTFTRKKFPGAVFHMENPKSTALIFSTGKVVLTGNHWPEEIAVALQKLLQSLNGAGITCRDKPQPTVTNMVCTYDLGFPLNLVRIVIALMDHEMVEYEPEAFPGLVWRISDPRLVVLLFSSGKIVIAGGKTVDDVQAGLDSVIEKLGVADNKIQRIEHGSAKS